MLHQWDANNPAGVSVVLPFEDSSSQCQQVQGMPMSCIFKSTTSPVGALQAQMISKNACASCSLPSQGNVIRRHVLQQASFALCQHKQ